MKKVLIIICGYIIYMTTFAQKGVVIQPIADLIGQQLAKNSLNYDTLPVASPNAHGCPRIHQLIFNEIVEIVDESATEYCVRIPHLFYVTHNSRKPRCYYWTDKKNILTLSELAPADIKQLPLPLDFRDPTKPAQHIATLIKPLHSKKMGITFSVGTRFVIKRTYKGAAIVYAFNPKVYKTIELCLAPTTYVRSNTQANLTKLHTFVQLLKKWAHMPGYVPYVWGGCSLTATNNSDAFKLTSSLPHAKGKRFAIAQDETSIKTGFDCAGLIARAAQAAEIPYFYKNTHTLSTYMKPVAHKSQMSAGDLIWIPGHVMAIGDLKKSTIIEARHYSHGYGKVHEIPLSEVFQKVNNFDQLFELIAKRRPLKRLHKDGRIVQTVKHAKILSMKSCFA